MRSRASIKKYLAYCTSLLVAFAFASVASAAKSKIIRDKSWVPGPAWQAVQERAKLDLGNQKVKVYKTRQSKLQSDGLMKYDRSGPAFIVHAKIPGRGGAKGIYLVERSAQGQYEAFPMAINGKGQYVSQIDPIKDSSITVRSMNEMPAVKTVHGLRVKATARTVKARLGDILAFNPEVGGFRGTLFVLPAPNKDDRSGAGAVQMEYQVSIKPPMIPGAPVPMPPYPQRKTYTNVHFEPAAKAQQQ